MSQQTSRLKIKVVPGAAGNAIAGWLGAELKVRVAAPPERGRANRAVIELIARALGLPKSQVTILAGETSPRKTVEITGLDASELRLRLERATRQRPR